MSTEAICAAEATIDGTQVFCCMRLGHPEVEGHFDSEVSVEWR